MEAKTAALMLLSLIITCLAFIYTYLNPLDIGQPLFGIPLIGLVPLFFFFGVAGFGYLAFFPGVFLGLQLGAQKNAIFFIYLAPITLALYAGIKLGTILWKDFKQEIYFLDEIKPVINALIFAVVLAFAIQYATPFIIDLNLFSGSDLTIESTPGTDKLFETLTKLKN